jgi:murein DD-endopeptidase MepM/ murein hydrolase activator NlpD
MDRLPWGGVKAAYAIVPLGLAVLVAAVAGAAAPAATETRAAATAVRLLVPGQQPVAGLEAAAPPTAVESTAWSYPADGSLIRIGLASTSVTAQPGATASAQALADAVSVDLFAGEIVVDSVAVRASAAAGPANATGDVGASGVTGLRVLGQPVGVTPGLQVPVADWGALDVLVGEVESGGEEGARAAVTGLRLRLLADHGGLPAGTEIAIGVAEARAAAQLPPRPVASPQAPPRPAQASPPPPPPPPADPVRVTEPGRSQPGGAPRSRVRPVPEGVSARLSARGYVFPVHGPASYGDSFGAPRGAYVSGWHHGEDIFAPEGTPLLAVADGTIFQVGWNQYGGWRLWLRDTLGNQFYYAHLSAYSPLAVEGGRVRAGDVIGFMGRTGDAEHSPPHLHFEIHPAQMLALGYDGVVAPYPYLAAWRRADDVSFDAGRKYLPEDGPSRGRPVAPRVGAVLLSASDISRASGLEPGGLERVLAGGRAGEPTLAVPGAG